MDTSLNTSQKYLAWTGIAIAIVFPSIVTLSYFVLVEGVDPSTQQARYAVMKCLQFAFPAVWAMVVLRDRLSPGLWSRNGVWLGIGFGLAVLLSMLALYWLALRESPMFESAAGGVSEKLHGLGIATVYRYAAVGVFYSLLHSLLEEYYWRWFVFGQLRRLLALWPAMIFSALGFTAHHVIVLAQYFGWTGLATWLFALAITVGGVFWAWLYERSGSIAGPWMSHLLVDVGIFVIGYEIAAPVLGW